MERSGNGRRTRPVMTMAVVVIFLALHANHAAWAAATTVLVGDYGYTLQVPKEWKRVELLEGGSILLHLEARPVNQVCGHFTAHVLNRGGNSEQVWIDFHVRENLPSVHGKFRIDSIEEVKAGSRGARLFHVLDISARDGYGLLEALVFTDVHVVFLSYLYDLADAGRARTRMEEVLASFSDSPAAVEKARLYFDEGRALSFDRLGLFMNLPLGWAPDGTGKKGEVEVSLPSRGSLRVLAFDRVSYGLDRLKQLLRGRVSSFPADGETMPVPFGGGSGGAVRVRKDARGEGSAEEYILGLHGRGGFALVLASDVEKERELFEKVCAKARLLDPKEARTLGSAAEKRFKKAIKEGDLTEAREALSTMVFCPDEDATVRVIEGGLKSIEEIQVACAETLGRMACKGASKALLRAMKSSRVCDDAKKVCIQSLSQNGGARERSALMQLERKYANALSPDVQVTLRQALDQFLSESRS